MKTQFVIIGIMLLFILFLVYRGKTSGYCPCGSPGCGMGRGRPGCGMGRGRLGCTCGAMSNGTYRDCGCGRCVFSDNGGALGTCVN